jgi:cytochrome d ubiquinol oxidase subunit I
MLFVEEGRQPWIIYNLKRVGHAVTPDPWLVVSFIIFTCIYILRSKPALQLT